LMMCTTQSSTAPLPPPPQILRDAGEQIQHTKQDQHALEKSIHRNCRFLKA